MNTQDDFYQDILETQENDVVAGHIKEMTSILVLGFNNALSDDEKCKALAEYMMKELRLLKSCGLLTKAFWMWEALEEVICEYGEPIDETYMGRDAEGEKQYHCFNPETNWNHRINLVLRPLMAAEGF